MWLGWSVALGQTTSTFCGGAYVEDTLPRNGDDRVPPDVVLAIAFPDRGPGCAAPTVDAVLRHDEGGEVPIHISALDSRLVQVSPDAPLAPGYYVLEILAVGGGGSGGYGYTYDSGGYATGGQEVWFRVEDVAAEDPGRVSALDVSLRRRCNQTFVRPAIAGNVRVDEPLRGVLRTRAVVDGTVGPWHTAAVLTPGARDYRLEEIVPSGLHELCVETELLDLSGTSVDAAGPKCFASRTCPIPQDRGLCASAPGGSWVAMVLAAAGAMGRRRPRDSARQR